MLASIADEVVAKPGKRNVACNRGSFSDRLVGGGYFITYMGSAAGTDLGRLIETDENYNIVRELPDVLDLEGTANILASQFSPHGLSVDFEKDLILTSDFVVPYTVLKPTLGIQKAHTCRLWKLSTRKIISTIDIPNGGGMQDVKFMYVVCSLLCIALADV